MQVLISPDLEGEVVMSEDSLSEFVKALRVG
jgi:hypothetical protein